VTVIIAHLSGARESQRPTDRTYVDNREICQAECIGWASSLSLPLGPLIVLIVPTSWFLSPCDLTRWNTKAGWGQYSSRVGKSKNPLGLCSPTGLPNMSIRYTWRIEAFELKVFSVYSFSWAYMSTFYTWTSLLALKLTVFSLKHIWLFILTSGEREKEVVLI